MTPETVPLVEPTALTADDYLLDVRETHEWAAGHAPGAVHLPMSQLPDRVADVPTGQRINVICKVGGRSAHAAAFLSQQGYEVRNVAGGMLSWQRAELGMVSETGSTPEVL